MSEGLHYTYRAEWSPEDDEWVGLVAEFPSLSHLDADPVEAIRGIRDLVEAVVADMRETGETPPAPLAERRYSGKVFVRTSPELHRRLTIEAAEQGVSVNQWATQKLAERSSSMARQYNVASDAVSNVDPLRDAQIYERAVAYLRDCAVRSPEREFGGFHQQTGGLVFLPRWYGTSDWAPTAMHAS